MICYIHIKRQLGGGDADAMCHLTAGMAAEGLACLVFVPVDVVKDLYLSLSLSLSLSLYIYIYIYTHCLYSISLSLSLSLSI